MRRHPMHVDEVNFFDFLEVRAMPQLAPDSRMFRTCITYNPPGKSLPGLGQSVGKWK